MADLRELSRDTLVWLVGSVAAAQTFSRVVEGFLDRRYDHVALYFVTTAVVVILSVSIETIKRFLEASDR